MFFLALFSFNYPHMSSFKKLTVVFSLFVSSLFYSEVVFSEAFTETSDVSVETCKINLINDDIEKRYQEVQKKLEQDFSNGLPQKLKDDLIRLRKTIDSLTLSSFDIDINNSQEVNLAVKKTIDSLETMIGILPQASQLAPKVRTQYVVPFTNMSSIRADQQDCLMKIAIEDATSQESEPKVESSHNIYKKLTSELNQLNKNLYRLETTDTQKFIGLRARLLADLEIYNKSQGRKNELSQQLPQILNSVQSEIERILPGLELSKKYYSIVD